MRKKSKNKADFSRVCLEYPKTIDANIEIYSALNGLGKNEVATQALREFLLSKGYKPDEMPKGAKY